MYKKVNESVKMLAGCTLSTSGWARINARQVVGIDQPEM